MENTTTIRLEINGEPAKNTLDELRRRAEQLADAISKVKSKELRVERLTPSAQVPLPLLLRNRGRI